MTQKLCILLVEDEVITATSIKMGLEKAGYDVCPLATRGSRAIAIAREKQPDIILMDVNLPGGMNGIEAAREILRTQETRIVFLTGYHDDDVTNQVKDLNPLGYVIKPVSIERIKKIIEDNF